MCIEPNHPGHEQIPPVVDKKLSTLTDARVEEASEGVIPNHNNESSPLLSGRVSVWSNIKTALKPLVSFLLSAAKVIGVVTAFVAAIALRVVASYAFSPWAALGLILLLIIAGLSMTTLQNRREIGH